VAAPSTYCGNGYHPATYLTHGTWFGEPDIRNCRYLMLFGTQNGSVTNHLPMELAAKMADARMDGMKLIVVDPPASTPAPRRMTACQSGREPTARCLCR
jgi:anaerobic selenocysteine-containing dehydrogenase